MRSWRLWVAGLLAASSITGCDDPKPDKNPFAAPPKDTVEPPPLREKPKEPLAFSVDGEGPKVGWSRVLIEKSDGRERLKKEIGEHKAEIDGKDITLIADRKAKLPWVVAMLDELHDAGAASLKVKTESRKEFPQTLELTHASAAGDLASCTVVTMVLEDRGTATWKIAGGTASKRAKGFAGPDLTTTAETLERYLKGCKDSDALLFSAADAIQWGLAYDLAASAKALKDVAPKRVVLLQETPVAGRPVKLSK